MGWQDAGAVQPLPARSRQPASWSRSLFDELLPHFTSKQFNVGCDETFDLGQGRSKEECERRGTERVYLDYLLQIHNEVAERGYTMQFWGDIIVQRPDLVPELPRDSIALEWGYEADHPFDGARRAVRRARASPSTSAPAPRPGALSQVAPTTPSATCGTPPKAG